MLVGAERKMAYGQTLGLHERPPERVPVEHAGGEEVGMNIDQQRGSPSAPTTPAASASRGGLEAVQ